MMHWFVRCVYQTHQEKPNISKLWSWQMTSPCVIAQAWSCPASATPRQAWYCRASYPLTSWGTTCQSSPCFWLSSLPTFWRASMAWSCHVRMESMLSCHQNSCWSLMEHSGGSWHLGEDQISPEQPELFWKTMCLVSCSSVKLLLGQSRISFIFIS